MKKVLSIILAAALMLSCMCVTVSAAGNSSKISDTLRTMMDKAADGEKLETHIWLYCNIDENKVFGQAVKECGYVAGLPLNMTVEEVNRFRAAYNRIVSEQEAAVSDAFVEKLGIADDDIVYHGKHPYVIANLTKEQIETAATYPEAESLSYVENAPVELPTEPKTGNLYKEKLKAQYKLSDNGASSKSGTLSRYSELYYHKDENGETDWALVKASTNMQAPAFLYTVIANRVFKQYEWGSPFHTGYGVYDVAQDKFFDADAVRYGDYPGFVRVFDEYASKDDMDNGRLLGDMDGDDELSVIDCTLMQRCDIHISEWPAGDIIDPDGTWAYYEPLTYYSDFNRDGDRDVIDVTLLQRYVTGLDIPYQG